MIMNQTVKIAFSICMHFMNKLILHGNYWTFCFNDEQCMHYNDTFLKTNEIDVSILCEIQL